MCRVRGRDDERKVLHTELRCNSEQQDDPKAGAYKDADVQEVWCNIPHADVQAIYMRRMPKGS